MTVRQRIFRLPVGEQQLRRVIAQGNIRGCFADILKTKLSVDREEIWTQCIRHIGVDAQVIVLEFGVYQGKSMSFWARGFTSASARLHGFDSFEGLPEDWTPKLSKGTFSTNGEVPNLEDDRVTFHRGWIQNSLPAFFAKGSINAAKPILVHIDVDLYSAALFVLTTLWHHLPEFFVMFDEFGVDENLALSDFMSAYPIDIKFYGHTMNDQAELPKQVFGHIKRTEYDPTS